MEGGSPVSNIDKEYAEMGAHVDNYMSFPMLPPKYENLTYDDVFSFANLYKSGLDCLRGVRWKASSQNIEYHLSYEVYKIYKELKNRKFKTRGFRKFITVERGKRREILAVHITERIVQKCFCDNYIVPLVERSLIYDNGACRKFKGITFSLNRVKKHLRNFVKENSLNGYVVTFDVKHFFPTIDRTIMAEKMKKLLKDEELYKMYKYFLDQFPDEKGLGLGSQISQISSLFYLNDLDHAIKDKCGYKYYGRYMDDGYCIVNSKEEATKFIEILNEELQKVNLELHAKKTQVIKMDKEFIFLKRLFTIREDGKIIVRPHKSTILRYKRKRKKLVDKKLFNSVKIIDECFRAYLLYFDEEIENYVQIDLSA